MPLPNKMRCRNLQRFIEDLVGQAKLLSKGEARRIAANIAKGGLIFALAGLLLLLRGRRSIASASLRYPTALTADRSAWLASPPSRVAIARANR